MDFRDADRSQKLDVLILSYQPKPKVGPFSFISQQSQSSVPYLDASNSCQNIASYTTKGGVMVLTHYSVSLLLDLTFHGYKYPLPEVGQIFQ